MSLPYVFLQSIILQYKFGYEDNSISMCIKVHRGPYAQPGIRTHGFLKFADQFSCDQTAAADAAKVEWHV
jgi:hypothetical protein